MWHNSRIFITLEPKAPLTCFHFLLQDCHQHKTTPPEFWNHPTHGICLLMPLSHIPPPGCAAHTVPPAAVKTSPLPAHNTVYSAAPPRRSHFRPFRHPVKHTTQVAKPLPTYNRFDILAHQHTSNTSINTSLLRVTQSIVL